MDKKHPLIGITVDLGKINDKNAYFVYRSYADAVEQCGGIPILLVYTKAVTAMVKRIDGLVITGGGFDIPPSMYGENNIYNLKTNPERTGFESQLLMEALKRHIPVLGVCGGMQLINVISGGSLYQDIKTQIPHALNHSSGEHEINIEQNTLLYSIINNQNILINTSHHQSVKEPGNGVIISAKSSDGVAEAIELSYYPDVVGVQWHPERIQDNSVYEWLVKRAAEN
ncbi:MAG: gamma-glutamyl-gamma-aminobutyrate hydrolase family protein [Deltaproteobacteria bacterium]|nr:gamma-glutamyl-gamma-aminobutyrate hydrolase family protein [Deltaproteobacteria bacterium]MCL5791479.1 gamma-glutamyl-gamma-aminobutyrate hydrolase family protein [Deltaproteobacteria bacterium]